MASALRCRRVTNRHRSSRHFGALRLPGLPPRVLQYNTKAAEGTGLRVLVLHDDAERQQACGRAERLADSKVSTFTQVLCEEVKEEVRGDISIKNNWKRTFPFEL